MLMCCLSCAKADSCEQADRVEDYCINHEERPMTNADRIRVMTDEELAEYLQDGCPPNKTCATYTLETKANVCTSCWLDWLKQEVTDA